MQEWIEKIAGQLDAAGAFLRERSMEYPVITGMVGGVLLMFVLLNLVAMPLRIVWWRLICWRNRLAGKLMRWSYDSDVADAIVAITNRYWASGRMSSKQRKEKFLVLAQALSLPELHPVSKSSRPLHPYRVKELIERTKDNLKALKLEKVKPDPAKGRVKLTIIKPQAA